MRQRSLLAFAAIFVVTEIQLLVGTFGGIDRFEGKGFVYRLVINTVLMLAAPAIWRLVQRRSVDPQPIPWWPCSIIASSFLFDALGNSLDLYDGWEPFDNVSHFVTWFLLLWGIGLFIARADVRPRWVLIALITGLGAAIAVVGAGRVRHVHPAGHRAGRCLRGHVERPAARHHRRPVRRTAGLSHRQWPEGTLRVVSSMARQN